MTEIVVVPGVSVEVRDRRDMHRVREVRLAVADAECDGRQVLVEAHRDADGRLGFTLTTLDVPRPSRAREAWESDGDEWKHG